jgi:ATP-dependent protease HslVU (ClpYQ) peptidase subunit
MTCIVAIGKNGVSWLGGDSAATSGDMSKRIIGESKVFVKKNIAFGVAGSPKILNALMNTENFSMLPKFKDVESLVHNGIVPLVKKSLDEFECIAEGMFEGAILFGAKGKVFRLESNFQVISCIHNFDSIGSGSDIAMGSLYATKSMSPRKRITLALEASADNNAGVCAPFNIVSTK